LMLLPALALYGLFVVYPVGYCVYLSFVSWDGLAKSKPFVGLSNYNSVLFQDPVFWHAAMNSLIWTVLAMAVAGSLGLALALGLNAAMRGRTVLRAIIYAPAVLSTIVVSMIWAWMYDPVYGTVNWLLSSLHLGELSKAWLGDPTVALYSVFVASAWQTLGVTVVLFLAGLQTMPQDLVEAARVDGASELAVFRRVKLPLLRPTFGVVMALTLVNSLKAFDLVFAMTNGGPANATQLLATWAYFKAFVYNDFGLGAAIGVLLLAISLAVVVPYVRWVTREL
jgi:raffinose/stachyose/melibiose transport system permease protein